VRERERYGGGNRAVTFESIDLRHCRRIWPVLVEK